jgi:hypothetical protein
MSMSKGMLRLPDPDAAHRYESGIVEKDRTYLTSTPIITLHPSFTPSVSENSVRL